MASEVQAVKDGIARDVDDVETKIKDVMRRVGRQLTEDEVDALDNIKAMGNHLHAQIEALGASRELSIAKTKLEEAVMWVSKHITA